MSHEENTLIADARMFLDELFGPGIPLRPLMRTGRFPDGWPGRYLNFVERVVRQYPPGAPLPREVTAIIYNASVYCTKRFHDWQRITGEKNDDTEQVVNQIRWAGDQLILGPYYKLETGAKV